MEETIGYEVLFSAEEWDSLKLGPEPQHRVTIWFPPGEAAGNENSYELECDICRVFATAGSEEEAVAENAAHTLKKGMRVFVAGNLVQRSWQDNDDNKRGSVEVHATHVGPDLQFQSAELRRRLRPRRSKAGRKASGAPPGSAGGAFARGRTRSRR